jgi:hypothetical protein
VAGVGEQLELCTGYRPGPRPAMVGIDNPIRIPQTTSTGRVTAASRSVRVGSLIAAPL